MIDMRDLNKTYYMGDHKLMALNNINIQIFENEFVAIIGKSGSGKSTLMNIIGCLDEATSGSYYFKNQDVMLMKDVELSVMRNREIGFIFQNYNLLSNLTAIENVEVPLFYKGIYIKERRKMAIEALERVGLEDRINHLPHELSGGQQQRVAIARAIICNPDIILADEPTGNLDSLAALDIMNIIKLLHSNGKTIVLITHDNQIASMADRIIEINDGKIIATDF